MAGRKAGMLHLPAIGPIPPRTGSGRAKLLPKALLPLLLLGRFGCRLGSGHTGRFSQGRRRWGQDERFRKWGSGGGMAVGCRAAMAVTGCAICSSAILAGQIQKAAIGCTLSKEAAAHGSWPGSSGHGGGGSGGGPCGRPRKPRTQRCATSGACGGQGQQQARQGEPPEPRHLWSRAPG